METGTRHGKDPDATGWTKGIDWTRYLSRLGDDVLLTDSEWFIACADEQSPTLALDDESIVVGNQRTQARFSGGTPGLEYQVTNRITHSMGGVDDRSFTVVIADR